MRPQWLYISMTVLFIAGAAGFIASRLPQHKMAGAVRACSDSLVGKPLPLFAAPVYAAPAFGTKEQVEGLTTSSLRGRVTVLNVFASWCQPCEAEHDILMRLVGNKDALLVGLNYKDSPRRLAAFLRRLGNPYQVIGIDENGEAAAALGVGGMPETLIINADGILIYRHRAPLTLKDLDFEILPRLAHPVVPDC